MSEQENNVNTKSRQPLNTRMRQRGLYGQITTALLRPALFFRTLLPAGETRQWLWAALIILALVGVATVRYSALMSAGTDTSGGFEPVPFDPGLGGDMGMPAPGMGGDFGGLPPGGIPDPNAPAEGSASTLTEDLTTALLTASSVVLGWAILTVMLIVVPMLRGKAPRFGLNLQIAVWSSMPLALMGAIQIVYLAAGGVPGAPGIEGVVTALPEFPTWDPTAQALVISFASRFTIFWLWSLLLVYFGIRFSLHGWRIVAVTFVLLWAVIQVGAPVVTGAIAAPLPDTGELTDGLPPGDMAPELPSDLGIPSDLGGDPSDAPADDVGTDEQSMEETPEREEDSTVEATAQP